MPNLFALLAGLLFGLGLILSGMTDPAKVTAFLDVAGAWDPSLAFVMGGALLVALPAFYVARRRGTTLRGEPLQLPTARRLDRPLIVGSVMFGAGWGLAGYCPGPALASLSMTDGAPWLFVAAMLAGMALYEARQWWRGR
ncbi:YeeE/YedE family protein [Pseudoduganella armeniaca]|uniref:YeeE/YedE family protein n=1 Tax=Pseudoduganella armeniaca TaxID=2072590 RepID=A0A2R4CGF3_9BURK|nr:YeeE/YedE family protein [Pseudoduganella armeniaca]AVR98714.1 hypothetical protein C9I28_26065 [Pseudoduganella armeniaca]